MPNPRLTPTLAERTAHRIGADTAGDFFLHRITQLRGGRAYGRFDLRFPSRSQGVHHKQQSEVNPDP